MSAILDQIIASLAYDPQRPLLFNSTFFLFFFIAVLLVYPLIADRSKLRVWFLLLVSLYFYFKTSGLFVILLIATALINYLIGSAIYKTKKRGGQRAWLMMSVIWNLGTLGYFKYTNFIIDTINQISGSSLPLLDIFLPVGISFFTFQTWSYTLDIFYGKIKPTESFRDFAFFVSFFPQLVAGPIVRAGYFIPQIHKRVSLDRDTVARALILIFAGLIKKGVIADYLSINFVDRVFDSPALFSGVENLIAIYAYALQIYCDFSGYSDIAIGIAALLGYDLPINFNRPYKAATITDFWRRWHISLSTWLRDYIYIPLGGNRKGKSRQSMNLLATMLLGGLWHGASWNFVFWGGLHGIGLLFDKIWLSFEIANNRIVKVFTTIITFHFVCFSWLFFRNRSLADGWIMIQRIIGSFNFSILAHWLAQYQIIAFLIVLGYLMHWTPQSWKGGMQNAIGKAPVIVQSLVLALIIWLLFQASSADVQPFIYFQF